MIGIALTIAVACAASLQPPPTVDPNVRADVAAGHARVIIELRVTGAAEPGAIAAAQDALLTRLAGTDAKLLRRFTNVSFLALEIGPTALVALEAMGDLVIRVIPDTVARPTG